MSSFPAFVRLAGRKVFVVGDGEAARAKVRLLEDCGAKVIRLSEDEASVADVFSAGLLAVIAVGDRSRAAALARSARISGCLVNVVDAPDLCDFTTPAILRRGPLVVALGTDGAAPVLASVLRSRLEALISPSLGDAVQLIGAARDRLKAAFPNVDDRRRFLRGLLDGRWMAEVEAGDLDHAAQTLTDAMSLTGMAGGAICLVRSDVNADDLTLREARALSGVDLLIIPPDASSGVINLARRDCIRLDQSDVLPGQLQTAIEGGAQVVWLVRTGPAKPEVDGDPGAIFDLRPGS